MKKEIEQLLNSENARLQINKFCVLSRTQKDGQPFYDRLTAYFSVTHFCDHVVEIKSRDWEGVVEELAKAQEDCFISVGKQYSIAIF